MKKIITLTALVLAAAGMAFATPVISARGFGGASLTSEINGFTADSNNTTPVTDNLVYGAGAGLNFTINGSIGIQPEVIYLLNNVGYQTRSSGTLGGVTTTTTVDNIKTYSSIDVPVLVTLRYNKFNLAAGPYASIPVSSLNPHGSTNIKKTGTGALSGSDYNEDTTSPYTSTALTITSKLIFGITAGLEYEERMGALRLVYGARYFCDFSPVQYQTKDSSGNVTTTDLFTRRGFVASVGVKMAL